MNVNECAIVLLGATGDLARKKIIPALYHLFLHKKLNKVIIIGAAREQTTVEALLERVRPALTEYKQEVWQEFSRHFFYQSMDFEQEKDFERLNQFVGECEKKSGSSGNRLIYCATAAYFFCTITTYVAASGLARKSERGKAPWYRIVYEKPFGHDVESAHQINACIASYFDEHQIFRIDHYLTKELVVNIALVRFTNCILEPLWNNRYIDQVQIILDEQGGIEERGAYYDKYGALADVMQNHMMELLALIAMESPQKLVGDYIRAERAKVLQKVKIVDVLLGQYKGYKQEAHVAADSRTETFAAAYARVDNPRWAGVPFYLKTGKCLDNKETLIYVKFKQVDCLLSRACPSEANALIIEISPKPRFALSLNVKKPGRSDEVMPMQMEICHDTFVGPHLQLAYEMLLEEILRGDQSAVSVRFDEIEYAWKIIDNVRRVNAQLYEYEKGSQGPEQLVTEFERKHGMRFRL